MLKKSLAISFLMIFIMVGLTFWAGQWMSELEQIPLHWDAKGQVDRYGTPKEAMTSLWFMVGMAVVLTGVFSIWPLIDPKQGNLQRSHRAYFVAWMGTLAILLGIIALIVFATHRSVHSESTALWDGFPRVIIGGTGIFIAFLGNYLPKTRSNWILGIRTPWSLSNEVVWEKTQRIGGYGLLIGGIVMVVSAFFVPIDWLIAITLTAVIVPTFSAIGYSYLVWRKEVRKEP